MSLEVTGLDELLNKIQEMTTLEQQGIYKKALDTGAETLLNGMKEEAKRVPDKHKTHGYVHLKVSKDTRGNMRKVGIDKENFEFTRQYYFMNYGGRGYGDGTDWVEIATRLHKNKVYEDMANVLKDALK